MATLFFPHQSALRLALANGLVPAEMSRAPVMAGFDSQGRLWLELAELPPRESLASLARVGVQVLSGSNIRTEEVRCWVELLSLVPVSQTSSEGLVLFVVPDRALARFVARLRRESRTPFAIRLVDDARESCSWVTTSDCPPAILTASLETNSRFEAFIEQIPGVWCRRGWQHPLPTQLVVPPASVLLLRPPRTVAAIAGGIPTPTIEEFSLAKVRARPSERIRPLRPIRVRLHLSLRRDREKETLWVLDSAEIARFWAYCASADERLSRRLEAAAVTCGSDTRLIVRTAGRRGAIVLPFPAQGYSPDARVPGLFVPSNRELRPLLREQELARLFCLARDRVVWLEPSLDGGVIPQQVGISAFRPVAALLEYTTSNVIPLATVPRTEPFALTKWPTLQIDALVGLPAADPLPLAYSPESRTSQDNPEPNRSTEPGWLRRSLRKLAIRLKTRRERLPSAQPPIDLARTNPAPPGKRVERNITSPDELLHGHNWAARRRELETKLFQELPTLGPDGRSARWADLAVVYGATGNVADAAVCWMNAVWETENPTNEWLEQWFAAECRAAKLNEQSGGLDRWLSEPGRPSVGRVVAAYTAWAGYASTPPVEFPGALPRILAFLDQHFDDLPVRAAWLSRLAATALCDGDVLGLARWRDRVLARLADRGPGLDLDEPSFLRFHGTASADRFQTAREWLTRVHDPALAWIQRHGEGGKLRWPGLDAETDATAAYAQFMLAWGLGCLGERTRARDWAAKARKQLSHSPGAGVDSAGHAVLGELFLQRVKDAQEGRPPKAGLPAELRRRLDNLSNIARYCVDRLREHSRILEPLERVRAMRGLELKVFWGTDQLAERLFVLADSADPAVIGAEAESLLRICTDNPATATVPRIVLTLFEVAPWLDSTTVLRLLDLLPTAIDWMEAWLKGGRCSDAERAERLVRYQALILAAACATAGSLSPGAAGPAMSQLVARLLEGGVDVRRPLLAVAGPMFRCLRRLKLPNDADALMQFLDPGGLGIIGDPGMPPVTRLGLGIGWFTAGNDDAGNRTLNEARERLYLTGDADLRNRTELAIAYAEALGFAPPRIAHGRLEEIFQRLGRVEVKSSTNRYFTLKPLQLIDTIVRSVVTDEFTLGPAVRGWLDDDEFLIRSRIHRDLAQVLRD